MDGAAIRLDHVWKRFRLGEHHESVRDLLRAGFDRLLARRQDKPQHNRFWALRDLNLDIPKGEAIGVIGPNGAGKSTLLKLLAGILRADRGRVAVSGRLAALIEVGAGFHGDLTGRENIFLNGAILGMRRTEVRKHFDRIVAFAGLERFIDTPVKRYSSGMYARLGFSIAAHVDPEILLVDEVLSVGDAMFRLRCEERMRELVRGGTTLVFVTHNLEQMSAICRRSVVLEQGEVSFDGDPRAAVSHYMDAMSRAVSQRPTDFVGDASHSKVIRLDQFQLRDEHGAPIVWQHADAPLGIELEFTTTRDVPRLCVEYNLRGLSGENLVSLNSGRGARLFNASIGSHRLTVTLPMLPLRSGRYFWNVRMWDSATGVTLMDTPFQYPMVIDDGGVQTGLLTIPHEWSMEPTKSAEAGHVGQRNRASAAKILRQEAADTHDPNFVQEAETK